MTGFDVVALLSVVVGCLLLWPLGRRLGFGPLGAGSAVLGCALVAVPVAAAGGAGLAGLALPCLVVAGLVAGGESWRMLVASVVALAAVLLAPVAAVGLLAGATCLVGSPSSGPRLSAARRGAVYVVGLGGALGVAVAATGDGPWALAPASGTAGTQIGGALVLAYLLALAGLTWTRLPWSRPISVAGVALGVAAAVPGTAVGVSVLAAPVLGFLTAAALAEIRLPVGGRRIVGGVAGVVLAAAAVFLVLGVPGPEPTVRATAAVDTVRPVRVMIPSLQVDSGLVDLGTDRDGRLLPPERPEVAGWFAAGPVPGDAGPAVIGGHVDSDRGPGVFLLLEQLREGDTVLVERSDGATVRFQIRAVERFAKDRFPTERVYGPTPGPELRLVTCGGAFDEVAQSYRDNVVVEAVVVEAVAERGEQP